MINSSNLLNKLYLLTISSNQLYISELEKKMDKQCTEFNSKTKEISSQINQMTSSYTQHKLNVEKISELEHSYSKLNNKTTS